MSQNAMQAGRKNCIDAGDEEQRSTARHVSFRLREDNLLCRWTQNHGNNTTDCHMNTLKA